MPCLLSSSLAGIGSAGGLLVSYPCRFPVRSQRRWCVRHKPRASRFWPQPSTEQVRVMPCLLSSSLAGIGSAGGLLVSYPCRFPVRSQRRWCVRHKPRASRFWPQPSTEQVRVMPCLLSSSLAGIGSAGGLLVSYPCRFPVRSQRRWCVRHKPRASRFWPQPSTEQVRVMPCLLSSSLAGIAEERFLEPGDVWLARPHSHSHTRTEMMMISHTPSGPMDTSLPRPRSGGPPSPPSRAPRAPGIPRPASPAAVVGVVAAGAGLCRGARRRPPELN